jgi:hypothetical protein
MLVVPYRCCCAKHEDRHMLKYAIVTVWLNTSTYAGTMITVLVVFLADGNKGIPEISRHLCCGSLATEISPKTLTYIEGRSG